MSKIDEVRSAMVAAMKAGDKERKAALSFLLSFYRYPLYEIVSDFFKTRLIHLELVNDGTVLKMDNIRTTV